MQVHPIFQDKTWGGLALVSIFISSCFFADVTDIWRLNKWKRIIVNSSGIYFEIIFCLILSIIGFFTKHHML
jgi:putative peptide zinc metalloprotease protein